MELLGREFEQARQCGFQVLELLVNHTSPGSVLGIFRLQSVEHLEGFVRKMPTRFQHFGFVFQFQNAIEDLPALARRELR